MPQDTTKKKFPSIKTKKTVQTPEIDPKAQANNGSKPEPVKITPAKIRAKISTTKIISSLQEQLTASNLKLSEQSTQLVSTQRALQEKIAEATLLSRQHELDIEQKIKSSKKKIIEPIVTYINNVVLAFQYLPQGLEDNLNKFVETLKLALQRAIEDLQKHGVEIIIPKVGEAVDPIYMNVLNPGASDSEDLIVKSIVSVGIKIDGQITQPVSIMAE